MASIYVFCTPDRSIMKNGVTISISSAMEMTSLKKAKKCLPISPESVRPSSSSDATHPSNDSHYKRLCDAEYGSQSRFLLSFDPFYFCSAQYSVTSSIVSPSICTAHGSENLTWIFFPGITFTISVSSTCFPSNISGKFLSDLSFDLLM